MTTMAPLAALVPVAPVFTNTAGGLPDPGDTGTASIGNL